ncbi:uncharacterized protein LOC128761187 [Synchiropus splendidus]|uniref:uncharacterized protein LOC128761187 n=1 Tax=Synchiropus splendidus TaxID=270530 RepID=UPI00237E4502|nr:uncharacterized protein LOC128761187 [Synchiropus splendidus]
MAEPLFPVTVEGQTINMLVDTGATLSSISLRIPAKKRSGNYMTLMGFAGVPVNLPISIPLKTEIAGLTQYHSFVLTHGKAPVHLMGRDLLIKCGATILCSTDGLVVRLADGTQMNCSLNDSRCASNYMQRSLEDEVADIYWVRLKPKQEGEGGVYSTFLLWKPWIDSVVSVRPPIDPLHLTLFYDRNQDLIYQEAFESVKGEKWQLSSTCIYVGKQGVAAATKLTSSQAHGHEARELGPMVKQCEAAEDWQSGQVPSVSFSPSLNAFCVQVKTEDSGVLEHATLTRFHGRELSDHELSAEMLDTLPDSLWSQGPADVGHCVECEPVTFEITPGAFVNVPQYPCKQEAAEGIANTLDGLWEAGVLEVSSSAWNTPILPVKKADGVNYRMAHDLREINKVTLTPCVPVPDPHRCALLVQYVDDLLIATESASIGLEATKMILYKLADLGFKVSKKKLQCCRRQVSFLVNVREMLSFLGLCGYSRGYIPEFAVKTRALRDLVKEKGMRNLTAKLDWTPMTETLFADLKRDLASATSLTQPNYDLPFHLDVSVSDDVANGVLYQKSGGNRDVLQYVSTPLDRLEAKQPTCTVYAAAVAACVTKTAHIVMGHQLFILTDHGVTAYVASEAFTMSSLRQRRLMSVLTQPHITFVLTGINMADSWETTGEPHECQARVKQEMKARPDLSPTPLLSGRVLFTDGCCWRQVSGPLQAGAAIMEAVDPSDPNSPFILIWSTNEFVKPSAQAAELLAVCVALEQCEGEEVTIYSDSAYVVGCLFVDLASWRRSGFVTATGDPVAHGDLIHRLDEAVSKPRAVAVVKCPGHMKANTLVARGNQAADAAAKEAAGYQVSAQGAYVIRGKQAEDLLPEITVEVIQQLQASAPDSEKQVWSAAGAWWNADQGLWFSPGKGPKRVVLPDGEFLRHVLEEAHGVSHESYNSMMSKMRMWWHPNLLRKVKKYCSSCEICQSFSIGPTTKRVMHQTESGRTPGDVVVMDYTDMITPVQGKRYLLVMVDTFSGWPEVYPCAKEDSLSVIKALVNHYIPTHGFPRIIRSDNGSHFTSANLATVERMLGLKHKFGSVYHPQSQAHVERMNRTLKQRLAKTCAQTGLNWLQALPIVLLAIRQSINRRTGFTPFELLTGRLMPGPASALLQPEVDPPAGYKPYWEQLTSLVSSFCTQDDAISAAEPDGSTPPSSIYLKVLQRKWSEPRWTGPFEVVARTSHAVQLKGKGNKWYHITQTRPAGFEVKKDSRKYKKGEDRMKVTDKRGWLVTLGILVISLGVVSWLCTNVDQKVKVTPSLSIVVPVKAGDIYEKKKTIVKNAVWVKEENEVYGYRRGADTGNYFLKELQAEGEMEAEKMTMMRSDLWWMCGEEKVWDRLPGNWNRIILDSILADEEGACARIKGHCCTIIPNNTAPDGKITRAMKGLKAMSIKLKSMSGIDDPLHNLLTGWFGKWKGLMNVWSKNGVFLMAGMASDIRNLLETICGVVNQLTRWRTDELTEARYQRRTDWVICSAIVTNKGQMYKHPKGISRRGGGDTRFGMRPQWPGP